MNASPSEGIIELETPPPSPTHIWEDDCSSETELWGDFEASLEYQVLSPQKRPRTYTAHPRRSKKGRRTPCEASAQSPTIEPIGVLTFSEVEPDTSLSPTTATSPHIQEKNNEIRDCPNGYYEYVESVTADIAGVYELNPNLFVVQGWDTRTLSALVGCKQIILTERSY